MPTPWYQFSLRSLLLFTLFVAVLCSIGISVHWVISVILGVVGLGGIVGRIVAKRNLGFLFGGLYGTIFGVNMGLLCLILDLSVRPTSETGRWLFAVWGVVNILFGVVLWVACSVV